jgi:hypothetical protein
VEQKLLKHFANLFGMELENVETWESANVKMKTFNPTGRKLTFYSILITWIQ